MLLLKSLLSPKQQDAISRLYEHDQTLLVADTGEGKTVMLLTAIAELKEYGIIDRVLVAAPARVVEKQVWTNEASKWEHLQGLRVVNVVGSPAQRKKILEGDGDVFVVSLPNLDSCLDVHHKCNGVVIDELSKAAGKQARRLANKKNDCFTWRVGMTATPVSQDFEKLYGMCRILDGGLAFGRNKDAFFSKYFDTDYNGYNRTLKVGAAEAMLRRIKGLVYMMESGKEEMLPPLKRDIIRFDMPAWSRRRYDDMRHTMIADDVEAANQAVKSGKLRQIASGFIYNEVGDVIHLDNARKDAARCWAETLGRPGLIFYEFKEQEAQLEEIAAATGCMIAQIQSMSHGVDGLQHQFRDLLFYQPVWSRDAELQAIGRVWRQGQKEAVTVTTLVCTDSLDGLVIQRVEDRGEWMELFKQHLK